MLLVCSRRSVFTLRVRVADTWGKFGSATHDVVSQRLETPCDPFTVRRGFVTIPRSGSTAEYGGEAFRAPSRPPEKVPGGNTSDDQIPLMG